jgi:hypothetical protein
MKLYLVSMSRTGVRSHEFQSRTTPVDRWPVATTLTATPSGDDENVKESTAGSHRRLATGHPLMVNSESVEALLEAASPETTAKSPDVRLTATRRAAESTLTLRTNDGLRRSQTMQLE